MTENPESPANSAVPPAPSAGAPRYPYAYPPGPYPGGYPPPPMPYGEYYPAGPATPPRNGLGVAALVLAVIALIGSCSVAGGILLGTAAVILGILGRGRAKRGEADNGGVALTGIILGFVAIVVSLAFIALWVGWFNDFGGQGLVDCLRAAGQDNEKVQQCYTDFQQSMENRLSQTSTPGR